MWFKIPNDIVSIEKVLNSRCSSSFDNCRTTSHWATFIDQPPPQKTIDLILNCCNSIPRFSSGKLLHWFKDGKLFLGFEKPDDPYTERLLHIESGMQHEAVYLACAALGVGTCILNQGINGTEYGEKIATTSHLIMQILDPYDSGKFTTKAPGPKKPFKSGKNLSEPLRDSDVECLPQLNNLTSSNKSCSSATKKDISQLLWAAKGRTPHYIRKHAWKMMWGLTIPTWAGVQTYTIVYLAKDNKLFRYLNWTKKFSVINRMFRTYVKWTRGNPTHDLHFARDMHISTQLNGSDTSLILCQNEKSKRAIWEVGYMLENILLQSKSLDISYETKLFTNEEILQMNEQGVTNAFAAILF
jgi:L-rhamnose mutarotase